MLLPEGKRSTAWVKRLPEVIAAINNEKISLTDKKPADAIKEKFVFAKPSSTYRRPVGMKEKKLPFTVRVRYLYQPGELEGVTKRATDPVWSLKVFNIERMVQKPGTPVMYYLRDGPKLSFVREELLVIPPDTQLPPTNLIYGLARQESPIGKIFLYRIMAFVCDGLGGGGLPPAQWMKKSQPAIDAEMFAVEEAVLNLLGKEENEKKPQTWEEFYYMATEVLRPMKDLKSKFYFAWAFDRVLHL